jgi:hypothetical protein
MATTTLVKTARTVVASVSNAASATTRGTIDLRTAQGGVLTMKLTNSGTLGAQCLGRVLVAHNSGTTPTAAAAGADWKTLASFGGGTTSGAITEQYFLIDAGVMHLECEFTGNTTSACVVEAYISEITSASTT